MNRAGPRVLGGLRLLVAAAILGATSYVLSWPILYDGLLGSDSLFHLSLTSWVQSTFPSINWWYPWDGNGMPFREGYPLAAHWVTALLAWASGWSLTQAMQVIQFAVNPLCALGVYCFCAYRLGRPLAGLVAGFLYLLSPMTWTFLVDWGFYPNQVATVLFMPTLFALDVCASEWADGGRGWRWRASALAFMALTALFGFVEPALIAAPLLAVAAYALKQGGWRQAGAWLIKVGLPLVLGALVLCAFWALPLYAWLGVVGSRQPAPVYSPNLFHLWTVSQVLELNPLQVNGAVDIYTRTSLSPAVWLPALAGLVLGVWDARARVFGLLAGFGLLTMTAHWLYALLYPVPLAGYLITFRAGMLYLQFLVPMLAAMGLLALPQAVASRALVMAQAGKRALALAAPVVAMAGLLVGVGAVAFYAHHVSDSQYRLAYGPFQRDWRDLWGYHKDDVCALGSTPLCQSATLTASFSVIELVAGCVDKNDQLRATIPICAALQDPTSPTWSSADDQLVASTLTWCDSGNAGDAVCAARYQPLENQLLAPRALAVGCLLNSCTQQEAAKAAGAVAFSGPPQRADLDASAGDLFKAFHYSTGGGQVDSYNYQLVPSPELSSWTKDSMLGSASAAVKDQLSQIEGIDAVVLPGGEAGQAGAYQANGWQVTTPATPATPDRVATPETLQPSNPTGLAEQRQGRPDVLVIGALSDSPSNPYNTIFEHATEGMIPFASGWLVKGRSPYVDDYSDTELAANQAVLLLGYRYHDSGAAWSKLQRYVRGGGSLFVETGWQYVDPDWNSASAPSALPVTSTQWGPLSTTAPTLVDGQTTSDWGSFETQGGAWGAAGATALRAGAEALVQVGGKVVVARWSLGSGKVLWSGMNLIAHQGATGSVAEASFLADQWSWLLNGGVGMGTQINPTWQGDTAELALAPSTGPAEVLFKESNAPGWSAQLVFPGGSEQVPILDAEADYMLVRLNAVPSGARLVFSYGPGPTVYAAWGTSAILAIVLLLWLVRPGPFQRVQAAVGVALASRLEGVRSAWNREDA